jgi:hypothetical protein
MSATEVDTKAAIGNRAQPPRMNGKSALTGSDGTTERIQKMYVLAGAMLLTALCACRMYWSWATWGDVSIDCGREVYLPAVLRQGQVLYRDVWYHYGPAAPYFNSLLFRTFGIHLYVAYFAGALSALASGIFLFLTGLELALPLVGWTAGAVVVIEAFEPGLFSFPLPYSFASVYGCAVSCALLWVLVKRLERRGWLWMAGAGLLAAAALLLKLEFGAAAYGLLALAIMLRWFPEKKWKQLGEDLTAIVPGLLICGAVIGWMISLRGASFITQENIMSWPTSFFMRVYGKEWLAHTGVELNRGAFVNMLKHSVFTAGILLALREVFASKAWTLRRILVLIALLLGMAAYASRLMWYLTPLWLAQVAFFPRAMVLYTLLGAVVAGWYCKPWLDRRGAKLLLVLAFPALLAFRLLLNVQPQGYAIYYNGPAALAFLAILAQAFRKGRGHGRPATIVALAGCLAVVTSQAVQLSKGQASLASFETTYGTLKVPKRTAENYRAATQFMLDRKARGEATLVVPEDTMLYFLTDTRAPTRVYTFTPGVLAPGKMTRELFQEIEAKDVRYLLWSNRTFREYGVVTFGRDFNQELAGYFEDRFRPAGTLVQDGNNSVDLSFTVWKRADIIGKP